MALTCLFAALGGIIATALCGFCASVSWWWLLPLWLGCYGALGLTYILLLVTGILLFLPDRDLAPHVYRRVHRVAYGALDWVLHQLGYRVRLTGAEKLPDTPFLLVCNHRSAFDPLCTLTTFQRALVFVAKPGVLRIPVIGPLLRRLGFMPIDRENARNAVTTIKQAANRIKNCCLSVGIYPEGTRSKDNRLLPFHAGSFKIASLTQCPIVVAAIRYEKRLLWGKRVHLSVVDVMDTAYVADNTTAAMADRAVAAITAAE